MPGHPESAGASRSPLDLLTLFAIFLSNGRIVDAFWMVSDRGPNFQCEEAELVIGLDDDVACPEEDGVESGVGRIYPLPGYSPSIFRVVLLRDGTFRVVKTLPLRTAAGSPITGLPNPLTVATTEVPRPAGYAIDGSLPAILAKRRLNRGIESLAFSPDFRHLYFVMQSPLDNPHSSGAVRDSANIRLFKLRITWRPGGSTLTPVGEWVYPLEPTSTFQDLGATDAARRRDLRVSEMLHLQAERFLVLERTDQVTALFEVDLATGTNILGTPFDSLATAPSLEQTADLPAVDVTPLAKTRRLVASSLAGAEPRFPAKLEGLARARDGRLLIVNDDDFGITDARTQINLVE